jgi:hypothetical protein
VSPDKSGRKCILDINSRGPQYVVGLVSLSVSRGHRCLQKLRAYIFQRNCGPFGHVENWQRRMGSASYYIMWLGFLLVQHSKTRHTRRKAVIFHNYIRTVCKKLEVRLRRKASLLVYQLKVTFQHVKINIFFMQFSKLSSEVIFRMSLFI